MERATRICRQCGKTFIAKFQRSNVFCSDKCKIAAKKKFSKRDMIFELFVPIKRNTPMINGVPVSITEKVREATRLGVSYGKLQVMRNKGVM